MKTLFVFLVGIALGACGLYYYEHNTAPTSPTASNSDLSASAREAANKAVVRGREIAANVSDSVSAKIQEWRLSSPDVRSELAKTGQVVRENTARARERVADVRIVTVIKAKYVLDRDLSVGAIDVESHDGNITLAGSLASEELVGKAVAHALDTEGVHHVTSKISVRP